MTVVYRPNNSYGGDTDSLNGYFSVNEVYGNYYYTKKYEPIFLKGRWLYIVDDGTGNEKDSLILDELTKNYEFTGQFFLVSHDKESKNLKVIG